MKLSEIGELSLLEIIRKRFSQKTTGLILGIGDDSAVIQPRNKNMLFTTDMMIEGVHFDLTWTTPYQIGFKLVSVNVSDIYAMGGTPVFLMLNVALKKEVNIDFFNELFDGIENAIKKYDLSLIGGDISSSDRTMLSASLTGYTTKILKRKGAKRGDKIYVTGCLGDSACGLEIMKRIKRPIEIENGRKTKFSLKWQIISPLVKRHLMPEARNSVNFVQLATSMIDISDGLLIDLSRICGESKVGARIYKESIPISTELRKSAEYLNLSPVELAFGGGEDYELLFTAPESKNIDAFCIGEITKSGIKVINKEGNSEKLLLKGYQHFKV
jgi:thiamine-monophosphate kinase